MLLLFAKSDICILASQKYQKAIFRFSFDVQDRAPGHKGAFEFLALKILFDLSRRHGSLNELEWKKRSRAARF